MKNKGLFCILAVMVCALLIILAASVDGLCQDKKVYQLKFAWNDIWGPKFRASQIYRPGGEMQRMLYERSNGRIQLEIISRMFPTGDLFVAVAKGKADMADVAMPWLSGTYPIWSWGEIPGIVSEDPVQGLAEELAIYQDSKVMAIYDETMKKYNLKFWFVTQWDAANGIWSKKDIAKLADRMDRLEKLIRAGGHVSAGRSKKSGSGSKSIDIVFDVICKFEEGIDFEGIKAATGFDDKKVRNIVFRASKEGKIKKSGRAIYVGA